MGLEKVIDFVKKGVYGGFALLVAIREEVVVPFRDELVDFLFKSFHWFSEDLLG